MSDKPIQFLPPMIRALLAGTKTQTRRFLDGWTDAEPPAIVENGRIIAFDENEREYRWPRTHAVGDRLYVREHWRTADVLNDLAPRDIKGTEDSVIDYTPIRYEADGATNNYSPHHDPAFGRFRQGMHMPRWASRITLTVTDVRVQRLQEISERDALAEGVSVDKTLPEHVHRCWLDLGHNSAGAEWLTGWDARDVYSQLWHEINGPGSWEANPWVAAYTFTVRDGNIDEVRP